CGGLGAGADGDDLLGRRGPQCVDEPFGDPSCAQDPPAQRRCVRWGGAGSVAGKPVGVIEWSMTDAASGDLARGDLAGPPRRKATEHMTGAPTASYELREHRLARLLAADP